LEFNVPFQHKYGYIRDEHARVQWQVYSLTVVNGLHYFCTSPQSRHKLGTMGHFFVH